MSLFRRLQIRIKSKLCKDRNGARQKVTDTLLLCKIGDKIGATAYRPYNGHEVYIHGEVVGISEDKKVIRVLYNGCRTIDFYDTDFGKTVFIEEELWRITNLLRRR